MHAPIFGWNNGQILFTLSSSNIFIPPYLSCRIATESLWSNDPASLLWPTNCVTFVLSSRPIQVVFCFLCRLISRQATLILVMGKSQDLKGSWSVLCSTVFGRKVKDLWAIDCCLANWCLYLLFFSNWRGNGNWFFVVHLLFMLWRYQHEVLHCPPSSRCNCLDPLLDK